MKKEIIVNDNIDYVVKWYGLELFRHRNVNIAFEEYKKNLLLYEYDGVSLDCEDTFPF